ncbi:MAG: TIGR03118 family protein, partial [Planctomycetaceae bacterium]|nr:TIGR03118 family protein [Planctomycetaceae bacterium]
GFTPYNIQRLSDGNIYVTYAAATSTGAPLPGGYVDEYGTAGNFIRRIATNGPLNAPWGLVIAPSNFGPLSRDLLIGNLYDSKINAYNLSSTTPTFVGSIAVNSGFPSPVGLWALAFGNGVTGKANTLYFTDGVNNQIDGLFGSISFVPEPSSGLLLILGGLIVGACRAGTRYANRGPRRPGSVQ